VHVSRIALTDFRSYPAVDLQLGPGVTGFTGPNGHGKTNLVEALGYAATLGSHRTATDAPLVRRGAERAIVRVQVDSAVGRTLLELEINPGRANRARLNRTAVRQPRQVIGALRTVLFAPEDLALVKGDPGERRRFLDDLLVTRSPRFAAVRADYERVVKQRTALLKSAGLRGAYRGGPGGHAGRPATAGLLSTLDTWDEHLAVAGAELLAGRLDLVARLRPLVTAAYARIADDPAEAVIRYRTSFATNGIIAEVGIGGGGIAGGVVLESGIADGPAANRGGAAGSGSADGATCSADGGSVGAAAGSGDRAAGFADRAAGAGAGGGTKPGSPAGPRRRTADGGADGQAVGSGAAGPTAGSEQTPGRRQTAGGGQTADREYLAGILRAALARSRPAELDRGVCLTGPHRDELELSIGEMPARGYASHGESWSLALALRLASYDLLRADGEDPVLLLDDVFAELDPGRRDRLAELAVAAEQALVTAAAAADVPGGLTGARFTISDGVVERAR